MKKTFVRTIGGREIKLDAQQDFIDDDGVRHPRNVLFLWTEAELQERLHVRTVWIEDKPRVDPITIPREPERPAPVAEPELPAAVLPPAPAAPPAPGPGEPTGLHTMIKRIGDMGIEPDDGVLERVKKATHSDADISELVAYGQVVFRTLRIAKKDQYHQGHRHVYDHVTNVISGSVLCEVEDCAPKIFHAPTQITIAGDKWHKFTALTDDVVYQCVYHQKERDDIYRMENSPYGGVPFTDEELRQKLKLLDTPCAHCDCDKEVHYDSGVLPEDGSL